MENADNHIGKHSTPSQTSWRAKSPDTARCIHCTYAIVQLHIRDDAIAHSPSCNQLD